jgi:anti-sigma factor RsiW
MFAFGKSRKRYHKETKKLLSIYLDGELDEVRKEELFDHLSSCKSCMRELTEQKAVLSYLVEALGPEDVGDIWTGIEEKIIESGKSREKKILSVFTPIFRLTLSYGTAALFGILIGVLSGVLSAGLIITDSYTTSAFDGLKSGSEPTSFDYLKEAPPNSLSALYFGSNLEEIDD